ncbi:MAG: Bug family tripartite tricarboxylate transporter substrate binding protein [Betaproteobacteria bacterium]
MRFLLLLLALAAAGAQAQSWPSKPVRMLITFPPGGPSEILTRLVNERLQANFRQPFVIENRVGAGGNVGADAVARSAPDGHTFGITTDTLFTVNPHVYRRMPLDVWTDIVPVTLLGSFSQMMVCHPSLAARSLGELLALAKRQSLSYASGGPGAPGHLAAELLLASAGTTMLHVPYKGPAGAATDVMGGQVNCGFLATPTVLPHVKSGKLNAFAVSTATRSPLAPDVPTAAEAGVANFDAPFYLVLFAPKATPGQIVSAVSREFAAGLAAPEVRQRAAALDVVTLGGTPEETSRTLKEAAAKWAPVVQRIGLKLD